MLGMEALALYVYLLSKPNNWNFSREDTMRDTGWGETEIRSATKELEDKGLLIRRKFRTEEGRWDWDFNLDIETSLSIPTIATLLSGVNGVACKKSKSTGNKKISKKSDIITDQQILEMLTEHKIPRRNHDKFLMFWHNKMEIKPKTCTINALKLAINNISKWDSNNIDRSLDKAIESGWQGLYEIKQFEKYTNKINTRNESPIVRIPGEDLEKPPEVKVLTADEFLNSKRLK